MAGEATVLFARGNQGESDSSEEDMWDDTALIEAYDRAVSLAKEEVQRRMGLVSSSSTAAEAPKPSHKRDKKKRQTKENNLTNTDIHTPASFSTGVKWTAGMPCKTVYHEDGELYEAVIESLSIDNGVCMLKFVGYENEQLTCIDDLLPSDGRWAQKQQIQASKEAVQDDAMDWINTEVRREVASTGALPKFDTPSKQIPFSAIPPPLPPSLLSSKLPGEESEALSSMLMSWYLNGFHTGYYMGLKQGKEQISSPASSK